MIFREFFDIASSTHTYLLASRAGGEALLIDPVKEQLSHYLTAIRQLDLHLIQAIDTPRMQITSLRLAICAMQRNASRSWASSREPSA